MAEEILLARPRKNFGAAVERLMTAEERFMVRSRKDLWLGQGKTYGEAEKDFIAGPKKDL